MRLIEHFKPYLPDEEMGTTVKTIFEVAREEAFEKGAENMLQALKLIQTTLMTDAEIAKELKIAEGFIKRIRQQLKSGSKP